MISELTPREAADLAAYAASHHRMEAHAARQRADAAAATHHGRLAETQATRAFHLRRILGSTA